MASSPVEVMTVDRDLVTRKLLLIVGDLDPLGAIRDKGLDGYLRDDTAQAVVERRLQRAIGRRIDVNEHLLTARGEPPSADYHASVLALADLGVLEHEFARRVARSAGLRNRLVHDYDDLDPCRVFEALDAALDDIPEYVARVDAYVKGLQREPEA